MQLTPDIAAEVVAACRAGSTEAAAALSRALGGELTLAVGEPASYDAASPPAGFDGPGLVVLLTFGDAGMVAVLPETSGLLPEGYDGADPGGASKLSALAEKLSLVLAPKNFSADGFAAAGVANIQAALARAGAHPKAALTPLEVGGGASAGQLSLIWPLTAPTALFDAASPAPSDSDQTPRSVDAAGRASRGAKPTDFSQLPSYSRSLLKVAVPVSVQLAAKKETVQEVVEIVPGSIIKFEKGCDQLLQMIIGGQLIAQGEAVKIGDKFGFRVTAMLPPSEHFVPLKRRRTA